jgi:serine/threonine protein kinase/WD40 repeat protein
MAYSMESLDLAISDKVPVRMEYEVKGEIARGGMGKIYSVKDAELDRCVALKLSTAADRSKDSQFFREAKILAALAHPNIVPIHTVGLDTEGRPFYSMKLIQGRTLQSIIKQLAAGDLETVAAYTRERLLDVFRKVCDAMAFAHTKGYLHRDLKPENIMVGEFGEVLVMDWGLAKRIRKTNAGLNAESALEPEPEIASYIEGTPQYMSPEQASGVYGGLDERSDIYSLGGILYAILMLKPPVNGSTLNEVLEKVRKGEITTMTLPRGSVRVGVPDQLARAVPETLRAVTMKALSHAPKRRYQSIEELAKDIESYQNGFVTSAEDATPLRLLILLLKRHRAASAFAALLLCGAFVFTVRLARSESLAKHNALRAKEAAEIAATNATLANKNALIAEENAQQARRERAEAKRSEEVARKAVAKANIATAEAAEKGQNAGDMQRALSNVPEVFRDHRWDYLSHLADSAETTIELKAISPWRAFQPHPNNPDIVFTMHADGGIRALNLKTGVTEDVFCPTWGNVERLNFVVSPNADLAAVSAFDKTVQQMQVWLIDLNSKTLKTRFEFPSTKLQLNFQFDKKSTILLATTTVPAQIYVFDLAKATLCWPAWKDQKNGTARLSTDERSVVLRRAGESPLLFSLADGSSKIGDSQKALTDLAQIEAESQACAYSISGNSFFSASVGVLRMFDTQTGRKVFDERLPNGVRGRQGARSSKLSYFADINLPITLTQISDDSAVVLLHGGPNAKVTQKYIVAIEQSLQADWQLWTHPLSKKIAVARGNIMKVWSLCNTNPKTKFDVWKNSNVYGFDFLVGSEKVLTTGAIQGDLSKMEANLEILHLNENGSNDKLQSVNFASPGSSASHLYMATSADKKTLGVKFSQGSTFVVWSAEEERLREIQRLEVGGNFWEIRFSPSGRLLWTSEGLIEVASGKYLNKRKLEGISDNSDRTNPIWLGESRLSQIRMIRSEKNNANRNVDRVILSWDAESELQATSTVAPNASCLDASPDGIQLAEGGLDMCVRIRDAATMEVQKTWRAHDDSVMRVAWHPSLPLLATASSDYSIRIWNIRTQSLLEEIRIVNGHMPCTILWSPDGRRLATSFLNVDVVDVYEPKACKDFQSLNP